MIKKMFIEVGNVLNLMGKEKWMYIGTYIIYFLASSFATYTLSASGCEYLIDGGIQGDWVLFRKGIYYMLLLFVVVCIIFPIMNAIMSLLKEKLTRDLLARVYEHLLELPINYFETHTSSGIVGLILNNLGGVNAAIDGFVITIIGCLITAPLGIYHLLSSNFPIGVVITFVLATISSIISMYFTDKIRRESEKMQNKLGGTNDVISGVFNGINCQKIYNINKVIHKTFKKNNDIYSTSIKSRLTKYNISGFAEGLVADVRYISILLIGIFGMIQGKKTIGEVMALVSISGTVYSVIITFFTLPKNTQESLVCANKIINFLNQNEDMVKDTNLQEEETNLPNRYRKGSAIIQFTDVTFQYRKGNTVLKDLTLSIHKGENVNFIGYSGNGKSTVVKLILGFYKTYQGSITIDELEIKETSDERIRKYISYVSQENLLFNCSVKENIQYGNLDSNDEDVIEVATAVGLHDFIMSLPDKYDTIVNFGGSNFSQEQCSKISIARAMLKGAPIVVLDEVMAKISPKNEIEIKQALDKLTKDKTVINIAHKLESIPPTERIIIFEKGKIVEDGIKQELLERDSVLKKYII